MFSIDQQLHAAFNPTAELKPRTLLEMMQANGYTDLTPEERLVEGSMIRSRLKRHLPATDYTVLHLYYSQWPELDLLRQMMHPIRQLVRQESRIFGDVDPEFFDLCCASELVGYDLFKHTGRHMKDFRKEGQDKDLLTRRKKRIIKSLQAMRKTATELAVRVLESSDMAQESIQAI